MGLRGKARPWDAAAGVPAVSLACQAGPDALPWGGGAAEAVCPPPRDAAAGVPAVSLACQAGPDPGAAEAFFVNSQRGPFTPPDNVSAAKYAGPQASRTSSQPLLLESPEVERQLPTRRAGAGDLPRRRLLRGGAWPGGAWPPSWAPAPTRRWSPPGCRRRGRR